MTPTQRLIPEIKNTGAVPFIAKVELTVVSGLDLPFHRAATILLSYRLAPKLIIFGIRALRAGRHRRWQRQKAIKKSLNCCVSMEQRNNWLIGDCLIDYSPLTN